MSKTQEYKTWKFEKSGDYYTDLAMKESTNNPTSINKEGYIGLYQFGERALVDVGYYKKTLKPGQDPKTLYNHDWKGSWTGKHGINSRDDFLASRIAQDIAVREYHQRIWERYLKSYQRYEGEKIGGIKLTKSGMISCAHLVGQGTMKKFIESNGTKNKEDGNGTTCGEYLKNFLGYAVDYSTDKYVEKLKAQEPPKPSPEYKEAVRCINLRKEAFERAMKEKPLELKEKNAQNPQQLADAANERMYNLARLRQCNYELDRLPCKKSTDAYYEVLREHRVKKENSR